MFPKIYYRRRLPPIQPPEGDYSITYRLAGSLPKSLLDRISQDYYIKKIEVSGRLYDDEKALQAALVALRDEYFKKVDRYSHQVLNGPTWLEIPEIATIVIDSLKFIEENFNYWTIWSYCIMQNHVHLECSLNSEAPPLCKILQLHKSFTAKKANQVLERSGPFWMQESFDRLIRDEVDFFKRIFYTLHNPVEAKLVDHWEEWPYTYLHPEIRKAEF